MTIRFAPVRGTPVLLAGLAVCFCVETVFGWGGEHGEITAAAIDCLPPEMRARVAPEAQSLSQTYCHFPDENWPCYGEWGGGTGDPTADRLPDLRREWDISFYCGWDPVLRKGKGCPHRIPEVYDYLPSCMENAVAALQAGRLEDGARFLGVMLHYVQDCGSFSHVQPIHRACHTASLEVIEADGYTPRCLGQTRDEAAAGIVTRVRDLAEWTEKRLDPLLSEAGVPIKTAKTLSTGELMPARTVAAVAKLRAERRPEFEEATRDCANEAVRACADVLHTVLALAPSVQTAPATNRLKTNLVFNPSFEEDDGDGIPDGWCRGWLDLADRMGRAEWYRKNTHWGSAVQSGQYSALLLWAPEKGLHWRQTWRNALRVHRGETYRGTAWAKACGAEGAAWFGLQAYDTNYQPLHLVRSEPASNDATWHQLFATIQIPQDAVWLRVVLHSEARDGAVWFDDIEVVRTEE